MNKIIKIFFIFSLLTLTACETFKKTEYVEVLVEKEIEKKYVLPNFETCKQKPILEKGSLTEFKDKWFEFSIIHKDCEMIKNNYENWIKRNFLKDNK